MFNHLRDVRARRRGEELAESGFTLIELLVVIVVLGILAATVVFALSGVSGTSVQAACNSDAKTLDVAVQAYINGTTNANNTIPTSVANLVSGGDITAAPNNPNYNIQLNGPTATAKVAGSPADAVVVQAPPSTGTWTVYDSAGTNPCTAA